MRKSLLFLSLLITVSVNAQVMDEQIKLSVSPSVSRTQENNAIIEKLTLFLQTKNQDIYHNTLWNELDFKTFITPYSAIVGIEQGRLGPYFYQATLMELVPTEDPTKKIAKLAYIGHNPQTKENLLRIIYNIVVNISQEQIYFSSYTDFATANWNKFTHNGLEYVISLNRTANLDQVKQQDKDIKKLLSFFNTDPITITYYSCVDAIELFNIKGFDYNPDMYLSQNGGLAEIGGIVYSANNAEIYTHEISHIYTRKLFPFIPTILDEGLATYFGGSGFYDYRWHKRALAKYTERNKIDYGFYLDKPYERFYINDETPVPYLIGALVCEYGINLMGKEKFVQSLYLINAQSDIWEILGTWGLTRANINQELNKILVKN